MKTLLTGATGLPGANLAHLLCSQGEEPCLLVREQSDRRGLRGLSYEEAPGDIVDTAALRTALQVRLGIREALRWFQPEGMVSLDKPLAPPEAWGLPGGPP